MNDNIMVPLSEVAKIDISGVDKKIKENEIPVSLCNFTDVYYNWSITKNMVPGFMKATANKKEIDRFSLTKGQVVITKDSETRDDIGMSAYIADDLPETILGYHCAVITPDEKALDGRYLNAYLSSRYGRKYFEYKAGGSGQRYTLTVEGISNIKIPLIPLSEQKKIGKFLSNLDKKIENNNAISSQLESLAKTIYDYWFLQFDFPDENGNPYRSSGGKMVWNDELKREIPEGWEVKCVKNCIQHINTGLNPRKNFILGNGNIKYITVKNLTTEGTIDWTLCETVDNEAREIIHKRSDVSKGDILFASIAPLGRCVLVEEDPKNWDINESVFSIRPNYDRISSEYLYMYFMSEYFIKKAEHTSTGSVFSGIRISALENMLIITPPINIVIKFTKLIETVLYKKYNNEKENQELASLRDFLLPLLMNGQVTVK